MNCAQTTSGSYHHNRTINNPSPNMGSLIHQKLLSGTNENKYQIKQGDVISIFGHGAKERSSFAQQLTKSLDLGSSPAVIDLTKVNDPDFIYKLEQKKKALSEQVCPERNRLQDRLKVALDVNGWFNNKPVQALDLEERAKMLLILELVEKVPDAIIINRPTAIKQFNRKLRALRQVYRKTYLMTDTIWNFPLSVASDRVFEIKDGVAKEIVLEP